MPAEIARMLGVSVTAVVGWKKKAKKGDDGLKAIPHPGRPRLLSKAGHRKLDRLLRKGAKSHGWSNELWTAKRVRDVIRREFGIAYHPEHVRHILKERLGWTSQKPERRARERDEAEIERWKREEFPRIKKTPKKGAPRSLSRTNRAIC